MEAESSVARKHEIQVSVSGVIAENLSQDGESSAEWLDGAGQQGGRLPLTWF